MFLDNLIKENQYPIIFIGAGLTKRYYSDAPSWPDLIKMIWSESLGESSFFDRYFTLKEEFNDDQFEILTSLAQELEKSYNRLFTKQEIKLPNLTVAEYYENNQSPFKTRIANIFSELTINKDTQDELKLLKSMLNKARFVVTTNYDVLIESLLDAKIKINIGSRGLFKSTAEYGELYKIHGSVTDPDSIIITKSDYSNIEKTNILVNAKILSKLTEAPIVFLGYSLTDKNIKNLLSDLSANMPYSISTAAKKIGVIAFDEGKQTLDESLNTFQYLDTTIAFTEIKTDNYAEVYYKLSKIQQKLSPISIRKFQDAIRTLILSGSHNDQQPVLVSTVDIDKMDEAIANRNIAIAIASSDVINNTFGIGIPDYVDYVRAYFLNSVSDFRITLSLDFIGQKNSEEMLPIARIVKLANQKNIKDTYKNYENVKAKISDRNKRRPNIESVLSVQSLAVSQANNEKYSKMILNKKTPIDIYDSQINSEVSNTTNALKFITKHIQDFSTTELSDFTQYLLEKISNDVLKKSDYRRYFLAYSFVLDPEAEYLA